MTRVIVPIGPQYAGKSTFCEKVAAAFSDTVIISRDKILIEMFGTVWLDTYSGGHYAGRKRLWKEVAEYMQQPKRVLILDTWNGQPEDRKVIVEKLRTLGATHVEGWHFVTPIKTCLEWSFERNPHVKKNKWSDIRLKIRIEEYSEICKHFRAMPIQKEGVFDSVRQINPLESIPTDLFANSS